MMERIDIQLIGSEDRPFAIDLSLVRDETPKPVIVFCHGFKGFKDWGCFDLVAKEFAQAGFVFVKMNFSHNGTTIEKPTSFDDLKAFGRNNFSKELYDLNKTIDWLYKSNLEHEIDLDRLSLVGHSRGGATVLLKAVNDKRIKRVVTWASISELERMVPKSELDEWKQDGVRFVLNGRTQQMMPLYWQLAEDFFQNKSKLDMRNLIPRMAIPQLIIHGDKDTSVPIDIAFELKSFNPKAEMVVIQGGDHTFGGRHPFEANELPEDFAQVVKTTIEFLA